MFLAFNLVLVYFFFFSLDFFFFFLVCAGFGGQPSDVFLFALVLMIQLILVVY